MLYFGIKKERLEQKFEYFFIGSEHPLMEVKPSDITIAVDWDLKYLFKQSYFKGSLTNILIVWSC